MASSIVLAQAWNLSHGSASPVISASGCVNGHNTYGYSVIKTDGSAAAKFDIDGTTYEVKKTMNADPRRIGQIDIVFNFPAKEYTERQKTLLWAAAESCPVGRSLHPEVIVNITMNFQG